MKLSEAPEVFKFTKFQFSNSGVQIHLWGWTEGDVESLYLKYGEKFTHHLKGEFALVLIDHNKKILLAARDPIGCRPLFYYEHENNIFFSPYIASLIENCPGHLSVNPLPLQLVLKEEYISSGQTVIREISNLRPGNILKLTRQTRQIERYFYIKDLPPDEKSTDQELIEKFHHIFEKAISKRLPDAGPSSALLSGGLDSSAITISAFKTLTRLHREEDFHTFSLTIDNPNFGDREQLNAILSEGQWNKHLVEIESLALDKIQLPTTGPLAFLFNHPHAEIFNSLMQKSSDIGSKSILFGLGGDDLFSPPVRLFIQKFWRGQIFIAWKEYYCSYKEDLSKARCLFNFFKDIIKSITPVSIKCSLYKYKLIKKGLYKNGYAAAYRGIVSAYNNPMSLATAERLCLLGQYDLIFSNDQQYAHRFNLVFTYPFFDQELIEFVQRMPSRWYKNSPIHKLFLRECLTGLVPDLVRCYRSKQSFSSYGRKIIEAQYSKISSTIQKYSESNSDQFLRGNTSDNNHIFPLLFYYHTALVEANLNRRISNVKNPIERQKEKENISATKNF